MIKPPYLTEWEYFVFRHQSKANIVFHHISTIAPVSCFWAAYYHSAWWIIPGLVGWSLGTLGHYIFKDGSVRGFDFVNYQTLSSLFKITWLMLKNEYQPVVNNVIKKIEENGNEGIKKEFFRWGK